MELRGIIPAIVTPMHDDETIYEAELRNQIDRQVNAGAAAIFCLGTNGEFYALSEQEKKRVIDITVEHTAGRIPVIAGTGCVTTRETIALTSYAKTAGADAASIITPYFAGLNQQGVTAHYTAVAEHCGLPVIIYNIPARTGVNVGERTLAGLAQHPNIIGVKDSSGNFDNTLRYLEQTPEDFIVLCGNDSLILWTLMAGGNGGISGIANLFPERMASICKAFEEGDFQKAKEIQDSVRTIRNTMTLHNPNSIVKRAANLLGHPVGPARRPFHVEDPEIDLKIQAALDCYRQ